MSEHWNVQISVQRVVRPDPVKTGGSRYADASTSNTTAESDRQITKILEFSIVADDEVEAYKKAMALLEISRPHIHRASCHGPAGELQCECA